jgi:hypothetical protein
MTMTFGVTSTGFVPMTQNDIVNALVADEQATMANDLDVSAESLFGQHNGVLGRQLAIAWENLQLCYEAFDPDAAEDRLLEMLCKLTGTFRNGDTPSLVVLTCTLTSGTTLTPFVAFAQTEDTPDVRWTPSSILYPSGYVAGTTGPQPVTFQSETNGAIPGFAGTIDQINTPITGWTAVINPNDAVLGLAVDPDSELRARREAEIAIVGSGTQPAIYANVSKAFAAQLLNLSVFVNDGSAVDSDGRPGHSVEVLIFDGTVPSIDNDMLAQTIYNCKGGGIQGYGNSSGTAFALVNGAQVPFTIGFSRAVQVPLYLIVTLQKKPTGYPGDVAFGQALAAAANAYFAPGDTVFETALNELCFGVGGVKNVPSILLGITNPPTTSTDVLMDFRSIARFDSSRIVVVSS